VLRDMHGRVREASGKRLLFYAAPFDAVCLPKEGEDPDVGALIEARSTERQVTNFLNRVLAKVVPRELLGSQRNMNVLYQSVAQFVRMKKNEVLDAKRVVRKIRVSDVAWLARGDAKLGSKVLQPTDLVFRQKKLLAVLSWIFKHLISNVMTFNFYATDSDRDRKTVMYFRKPIWNQILRSARMQAIHSGFDFHVKLHKMDPGVLKKLNKTLVAVRVLPKTNNARIIQVRKPTGEMQGILMDIQAVLLYEYKSQRKARGASVFTFDELYSKLLDFKAKWKAASKPFLYLTSTDFVASFDTINRKMLLRDVLPSVLIKETYAIVRYSIRKRKASGDTVVLGRRTICEQIGDEASLIRMIRKRRIQEGRTSVVLGIKSVCFVTREQILELIRDIVTDNLLNFDGFLAVQNSGIPQGLTISSILASMFYAYLEHKHLRSIRQKHLKICSTMARFTDDMLLCSSSLEESQEFLAEIESWSARFGTATNEKKTQKNYCSANQSLPSRKRPRPSRATLVIAGAGPVRVPEGNQRRNSNVENAKVQFSKAGIEKDKRSTKNAGNDVEKYSSMNPKSERKRPRDEREVENFVWCGIVINPHAFEVEMDVSKFYGKKMRDQLNVVFDEKPGATFLKKVGECFNSWIHPLFFDSNLNSNRTVALNIYRYAVIVSMKFCSYLDTLVRVTGFIPADKFFSNAVGLLRKSIGGSIQLQEFRPASRAHRFKLPVRWCEVRFLVNSAVMNVLLLKSFRWDQFIAEKVVFEIQSLLTAPEAKKFSGCSTWCSELFFHVEY